MTTYHQVVIYLIATYATDEVIVEADAEITYLKQPKRMSAVRNSEVFWKKAVRCDRVYEEALLNRAFTEGLQESVRFFMRTYWGVHKDATLLTLARLTRSLFKLPEGSNSTSTLGQHIRYDQCKSKMYSQRGKHTPIMTVHADARNLPRQHHPAKLLSAIVEVLIREKSKDHFKPTQEIATVYQYIEPQDTAQKRLVLITVTQYIAVFVSDPNK